MSLDLEINKKIETRADMTSWNLRLMQKKIIISLT